LLNGDQLMEFDLRPNTRQARYITLICHAILLILSTLMAAQLYHYVITAYYLTGA